MTMSSPTFRPHLLNTLLHGGDRVGDKVYTFTVAGVWSIVRVSVSISRGMVALNSNVWRSLGNAAHTFLTSCKAHVQHPVCFVQHKNLQPGQIHSRRSGVAMRTSTPHRSAVTCGSPAPSRNSSRFIRDGNLLVN